MLGARTASSMLRQSAGLFRQNGPALRRLLFITTQETPNVNSLQFFPGKDVLGVTSTVDFPDFRSTQNSPLARNLFKVEGVNRVFLGNDFVTVSKEEGFEWDVISPQVFEKLTNHYMSGEPVLMESAINQDTAINEDDSETVAMIKELLDSRIRPAVQEDGGDIYFERFDVDEGIVWLRMAGACSGCESAAITLKNGVENMLMHYVPDVREVREVVDEDDIDAQNRLHFENVEARKTDS